MELFTPEVSLIFWMLIPFLVVFFILAKFAWPAILKGVEERNKFIDDSLLMAQQARDQLSKIKEESDALIAEARKEQALIKAEATKNREQIIRDAKEKAGVEAASVLESARKQLLLEKEDAVRDIRRMVAGLSVEISEKVLREKLNTQKSQMEIIDRLLNEVNIPKS